MIDTTGRTVDDVVAEIVERVRAAEDALMLFYRIALADRRRRSVASLFRVRVRGREQPAAATAVTSWRPRTGR